MKIVKEYKIKDGITLDDIKTELKNRSLPVNGASTYISKDVICSTFKLLVGDITVNIGFPEDLTKWDSFDHVLVMDESFGQPYEPFYIADENESRRFAFVLNVIGLYNKFMDSLPFLERK